MREIREMGGEVEAGDDDGTGSVALSPFGPRTHDHGNLHSLFTYYTALPYAEIYVALEFF